MALKKELPPAQTVYDSTHLTSALQYHWLDPNPSRNHANPIEWSITDGVSRQRLVSDMVRQQWRVDYLRQKIAQMGESPRGRRRQQLVEQFVDIFLSPDRIARQIDNLGAETRRLLPYLLLNHSLVTLRTRPTLKPLARSASAGLLPLVHADLAMQDSYGNALIPIEVLSCFPSMAVDFPAVPEPSQFVQAPDPHVFATQIQQWLTLVQAGEYKQRARVHWSPPQIAYMGKYQVWPPTPESAQKVLNRPNSPEALELCASMPFPDQPALDDWSASLGVSSELIEFIYHAMVFSQVVLPGSPIALDSALAQKWLMQTPGEQAAMLYHLHRGLKLWSEWWPLWRQGRIRVFWDYQNYWQITMLDETLLSVNCLLRWVLLEILAVLPHSVWLSLDAVAAFIETVYPKPATHLYMTGLTFNGDGSWSGFLSLALRALLTGPLHFMGFVDVAPDLETLTCFRLRHLQDIHRRRLTEIPSTTKQLLNAEKLRYNPKEKHLLITPPVSPTFLTFVQRWAKPAGLSGKSLHYQLDLERLHTAFENGETLDSLIRTWEENADFAPLPDIVAWWRYWGARYGHVRIYSRQATLMTRDEFTMREIQMALPAFRDAMMGLITPRTALLQSDHVDEILSGLERQGYMPKEEA